MNKKVIWTLLLVGLIAVLVKIFLGGGIGSMASGDLVVRETLQTEINWIDICERVASGDIPERQLIKIEL